MKRRPRTLLVLCAAIASACVPAHARSAEQDERIAASFMLARGRAPSAGELEEWATQLPASVADLVARHREALQGDAAATRATIVRAAHDAFGRAPGEEEIANPSGRTRTYTELMQRHLRWLAGHPAEYEQVVHRAYRLLVRREAYSEEIDYWKRQDTLTFALLVGCIEDWARRNQPGLMVTTGTPTISVNSDFLETVRLSPALAAEARATAGLVAPDDATFASAFGRNLVAVGASSVLTGGRIHFVAAGAATLVP